MILRRNQQLSVFIVFVLLMALPHYVISQTEVKKYSDDKINTEYHVTNGMLNGKYGCFYKNGKKKAEGNFEFNNKIGEWSVWDTAGKLCLQRIYTNGYVYKRTVPTIPDGPAKLLCAPIYEPVRNVDSCYKYYYLFEKNICWSKRTWSYLYNKDNPTIGTNNRLFSVFYKQILSHHIQPYKVHKDWDKSFRDSADVFNTPIDTSTFNVIGFLIKEDWYYDVDYGMLDCRILGFCPIAVKRHLAKEDTINARYLMKNVEDWNRDTVGLFWVFYPQARKYLAMENVTDTGIPNYVKNLDDVFFWRYYSEIINDESAMYGMAKVKDSWALRSIMLNLEHNIWMGGTEW